MPQCATVFNQTLAKASQEEKKAFRDILCKTKMLSRTDKTVTIAAAVAIVKLAVASVFVTASLCR